MLKAYRYRLYPNAEQAELLNKTFGCCRFVYNEARAFKKQAYDTEKKTVSRYELDRRLPELKKQFPWLSEVYSQTLQQSIAHLEAAYQRFFKQNTHRRRAPGFPKFKSKHDRQSASFPQNASIDFVTATLRLPKIGDVPLALSRTFEGRVKTVTVSRTSTGKFFAAVLVEDGIEHPTPPVPDESNSLGIDVGLTDFAILSTGEKIANPRKLRASLRRLRRLSRSFSRKKKESRNRAKSKRRLALLHEKVVNQRQDFLHKTTHRLVVENQATTLCVEALAVQNLMRNKRLSRSIADAAWGEFLRQIIYKALWNGKNLLKAGRFDATSKTCGECGWKKHALSLRDREWYCLNCGAVHDRDINAAKNIVRFAFGYVPRGHSESKACGQDSLCSELCSG
jgi:putative transposase